MIASRGRALAIPLLAALATAFAIHAACAAEEETLRAFAAWQGEGHFVQTGTDEATFAGMLSGRLYIDTDQGPIDAGNLVCPVVVDIDLKTRTQAGSGKCTFTGREGNQAYMDLSCIGVPLVGCAGESKLTGGTGRFATVSGGGHFVIRSSLHELAGKSHGMVADKATGIIFWRALHYKIP